MGCRDFRLYLISIPPDPDAPEGLSRLFLLPGWEGKRCPESGQPHPAHTPWPLSTAFLTPA